MAGVYNGYHEHRFPESIADKHRARGGGGGAGASLTFTASPPSIFCLSLQSLIVYDKSVFLLSQKELLCVGELKGGTSEVMKKIGLATLLFQLSTAEAEHSSRCWHHE
ncbi:hypothetical protein CgunFtcFv8_011494 [Champsocephalus gunnari]|uniref:Uncharacterized protein n=1 Tax=Champsocephalus gunnari TaxID=52237 RepID=A0AAN8D6Z5_CHAGU|nr:hypothetical protein CgunFtcFv8_011494 [Champsocephalus gunnari]